MDHLHKCPACNRPFDNILDYPSVRFLAFQRLPVPEAVDAMSAAAAEKKLARERQRLMQLIDYHPGEINKTPAIGRLETLQRMACDPKSRALFRACRIYRGMDRDPRFGTSSACSRRAPFPQPSIAVDAPRSRFHFGPVQRFHSN